MRFLKFRPQDEIVCINKDQDWFDVTIGSIYRVVRCYMGSDGVEYVELEYNDSDESCFEFRTSMFSLKK